MDKIADTQNLINVIKSGVITEINQSENNIYNGLQENFKSIENKLKDLTTLANGGQVLSEQMVCPVYCEGGGNGGKGNDHWYLKVGPLEGYEIYRVETLVSNYLYLSGNSYSIPSNIENVGQWDFSNNPQKYVSWQMYNREGDHQDRGSIQALVYFRKIKTEEEESI